MSQGKTKRQTAGSVADTIAIRIHEGVYPGRLPPIHSLAAELGVNFKTVNRAVSLLVEKHILESRRRVGTRVADGGMAILADLVRGVNRNRQPLFFVSDNPHLYRNLVQATIAQLSRRHLFSTVITGVVTEAMLAKVMQAPPSHMVLDMAWDQFPHERLVGIERMGVRLVFSFRAEFDLPLNADYILADLVYGAYIATKHLIALGHRRILHLTMELIPPPDPMVVRHTALYQLLQGYRLALAEAGLEEEEMVLRETHDQELNRARLGALLSGPNRPTAILASEDYRFLKNYPTIRSLGLKIPDDLAVVGYYDTPHCLVSEVPLTSVSVNVAEIARLTAERVISSAIQRRHILVKPELVVRESCGGGKAATGKAPA